MEAPWGDTQYAAGWMPETEALRLINSAAAQYRGRDGT